MTPRTHLVTGSASGIGRALAQRLRAAGHRVIGVDLRDAEIIADLSTVTGREHLAEQAAQLSGGRLDGIAVVAGLAAPVPDTVSVNYFGALAALEPLRGLLLAADAPRVVLVGSMDALSAVDDALVEHLLAGNEAGARERAQELAGQGPEIGAQVYSSSKAALTRWMRLAAPGPDWAGAGIPLNAIAPGVVLTPMTEYLRTSPEALEALMQYVPMPLNGPMEPESCAALLDFLLGEENTHMCGQVVFIDGGFDALTRGDSVW